MSRDPIERSLEIEQAQLRGFARSFAEVEWLLLILVVLYLYIANPVAPNVVAIGVLLGFAGFILLFRYGRPFAKHTHFKLAFEILVMLAFLTAVAERSSREVITIGSCFAGSKKGRSMKAMSRAN